MAENHLERLRTFLTHANIPKLLGRDIQAILEENAELKRHASAGPARWEKLIAYFTVNEVDMVLYLHARMGHPYWTCMLWSTNSSCGDGDTPDIAIERAFLKLRGGTHDAGTMDRAR